MISIMLALQTAPVAEMKSSMPPVSIEESVEFFNKVCFETFPDAKRALEVIASPDLQLSKLPETPSEAMQPGDAWSSPKARVTYVDADWLPLDLGSPQCSVTMVVNGQPLHSEIASVMAATLQLPAVKFGKERRSSETMWDVPQTNGDKWRLFLTSTKTPSETEFHAVIMNLRSKRKK